MVVIVVVIQEQLHNIRVGNSPRQSCDDMNIHNRLII